MQKKTLQHRDIQTWAGTSTQQGCDMEVLFFAALQAEQITNSCLANAVKQAYEKLSDHTIWRTGRVVPAPDRPLTKSQPELARGPPKE